jgi:hypothetical protein
MAVDRYRPFGQGRGVACDRRSKRALSAETSQQAYCRRLGEFEQGNAVGGDAGEVEAVQSSSSCPISRKKEDDALQSAEVAVTEITVAEMSAHKFKIGQVVNYSPRLKVGAGVYQIAQLMPPAGDVPQYRIKSEAEGHLRAAVESELSPLNRR